jgi:hypothetical protein
MKQLKAGKPLPPAVDQFNVGAVRQAAVVLKEFQRLTGTDTADAVSDLLTNLMHWCDRFGQAFPEELRRALSHYAAETGASSGTTLTKPDKM